MKLLNMLFLFLFSYYISPALSEIVADCNAVIDMSTMNESVVIRSHQRFDGETLYKPGQTCRYTFKRGNALRNLEVTCSFFDVSGNQNNNCKKADFLLFHNGDDIVNEKFCGVKPENTTLVRTTSSRPLKIRFKTLTKQQRQKKKKRRKLARNEGFECVVTGQKKPDNKDCQCGRKKHETKIVGGVDTSVNEYPWQAGLQQNGRAKFFCGGSVVNDQWVFTAAHCMVFPKDAFRVVLGEHDTSTGSETDAIAFGIAEIHVHPGWDSATVNNDYALLKLDRTIDFSLHPHIRPVCMPTVDVPVDEFVTITGWGRTTENGVQSDALQEVDVEVISQEACANDYAADFVTITDKMFCAGDDAGGKDSCQGDSGGPCVYNNEGNYELLGVTSFGIGCARQGYPGVYANVLAAKDWWSGVMGTAEDGCPRSA